MGCDGISHSPDFPDPVRSDFMFVTAARSRKFTSRR
jgi:hypothetical protein